MTIDEQLLAVGYDAEAVEKALIDAGTMHLYADPTNKKNPPSQPSMLPYGCTPLQVQTAREVLFFMESLQPSNGAATFTPIEYSGQRVLLTAQLAFGYGTTPQIITNNYNRNKDHYKPGVHYFALEGQDKRDFVNQTQIDLGAKNAATLYLWTERGTLLHAKSLGTEQAWATHEKLVDTYFRAKENAAQLASFSPQLQALMAMELRQQAIEAKQAEQGRQIEANEKGLRDIREAVRYNPDTWREDTDMLIKRITQARGSQYGIVRGEIYKELEARAHCDLDNRLGRTQRRALEAGNSKTAANQINKLDIIAADPILIEIFCKVVAERAIEYGIPASIETPPKCSGLEIERFTETMPDGAINIRGREYVAHMYDMASREK